MERLFKKQLLWLSLLVVSLLIGTADVYAQVSLRALETLVKQYSYSRIQNTKQVAKIIYRFSNHHGLDPLLVLAVIHTESHFKTRAVSNKGAVGLMQVLPSTAKEVAGTLRVKGFNRNHLLYPYTNIRLGTYYLKYLKKRFHNNRLLFLSAYNLGPTKLLKLRRKHKKLRYRYAKKVLRMYRLFKRTHDIHLAKLDDKKRLPATVKK